MSGSELPIAPDWVRQELRRGLVIPAHPLALTHERKLDVRRQCALTRYYHASGAGGLAVGVHTTQFAIRDSKHGLLRPVLELAGETAAECDRRTGRRTVMIAGICGRTGQAVAEARLARGLGYHAGLVSLAALAGASDDELMAHCRAVAGELSLIGFYLQPAVGGRLLSRNFWRRFAQIENVVAIKIAPFNRYGTLDVMHGVAASGRADEIVLYTGNDDHIVGDLVTRYRIPARGGCVELGMSGGLLGQWACWTRRAVELLDWCRFARESEEGTAAFARDPSGKDAGEEPSGVAELQHSSVSFSRSKAARHGIPGELLSFGVALTDANAAIFDAANQFRGCIAGIHEVLRRQGLMSNTLCLDPEEGLSPGQAEEIDRVYRAYPDLNDDSFVAAHLDEWLGE